MDTLSSSVSTLNVPALPSSSRHLYTSKTPSTYHTIPLLHSSNSNSTKSITQFCSLTTLNYPLNPSQFSSFKLPPTVTHRNPATGYAAALVDMLQSHNYSLDSAVKDVRGLSRVLHEEGVVSILRNPVVGEKDKGRIIKEVGKFGKFNRFLVRLMMMLVEKNKVGILNQVLVEFQRICDELSGTKVVMVSTKKKMEENEVFGIAQRVPKLSGAVRVKQYNQYHQITLASECLWEEHPSHTVTGTLLKESRNLTTTGIHSRRHPRPVNPQSSSNTP